MVSHTLIKIILVDDILPNRELNCSFFLLILLKLLEYCPIWRLSNRDIKYGAWTELVIKAALKGLKNMEVLKIEGPKATVDLMEKAKGNEDEDEDNKDDNISASSGLILSKNKLRLRLPVDLN